MRLIRLLTRGNHGGDTEAVTTSPTAPLGGGRRRAVTAASCAMAAALVAGVFSVVAITTTATVAGASTTPVTATWSSSPNCTSYQTATPPVGTVSATLVLSGGGGGGGGTNSGSGGSGGAGGEITSTTFSLTHTSGIVSAKLGCGGSGGGESGSSDSTINGPSGATGYSAGGNGGSGSSEFASIDGESSAGAGGGSSALCLGSGTCTTLVAVGGGGGGGGARWDCTGSTGPGGGGEGGTSNGANGGTGDGSDGAGGNGGTSSGGGSGGSGDNQNGSTGGGSPAGAGGNGGNGKGSEAGAGGGGAGGGYTGGGGGGGDGCTSGSDAGGGGGGGASYANSSYTSGASYGSGSAGGGSEGSGTEGSISLTWNVASVSITTPSAQTSTSGTAISNLAISASDSAGLGLTYSASGLPPGLSINSSTGVISGTPTTGSATPSSVTVTATDTQAATASTAGFTWTVNNAVTVTNPGPFTKNSGTAISPVSMSATTSGSAGGATISPTGWSVSSGSLPTGLSLSTAGVITGTPTTAGSYSSTIQATDSAGFHGTTTVAWTINNVVTVTAPSAQTSNAGTAIANVTVTASDSSSTATITGWSLSNAPPGLTISSSGVISGTPTTGGTYSVTATATDSKSFSGTSSAFSWTVNDVVTVTNPGNQSNVSGTAITGFTPSASVTGGGTISSWAQSGLPSGLSFNSSTGAISGTPTTACSCSVTLTATDNRGAQGSATFTWTVSNTVAVTNPGTQSNVTGSAITALQISATDSQSGATLTYSATGLPGGLNISSSGLITGTPTAPGSSSVTVTATDGSLYHASTTFTWNITNAVSVTNPGAQSGVSGSAITALQISATDSQSGATLTYSATGVPAGLTISSSGSITGTPTTACACSVTVKAQDAALYTGTATFTWNVTNTVSVTNPGAQSNLSGSAITAVDVTASDSSSTATLSYADGGTLPPGLSIGGSGAITGTPTTAGSYPVTITVTDNAGYHAAVNFTWVVTNTVSVTSPGNQSNGSGSAITAVDISASDSSSTAALAYADNGTLPLGLTINALNGDITGTPTTGGLYPVTITVTDNAGYSNVATFNWTITNTVSVTSPGDQSSVSGSAITAVSVSATDTSSTATLAYSDNGTLPPGLSIDPISGSITGTPTTKGTYPVTITVTDSAGYTGTASFNWDITNTISVTNPGAQSNGSGSAITAVPISASDSSPTATLAYSDGGTLPPGLSIDPASGSITGTPTTGGVYPVTITITDDSDASASVTFTWTITNTVSVTNPGAQSNGSGAAITAVPISATDSSSTATVAYSDGGTLPPGLSIDAASGAITGTPTTAGSYPVTITAIDNAGYSGNTNFTWTITNTVSVTSPGDQSDGSGTAITAAPVTATDSSSTATLTYSDGGTLPAGLSIDPTTGSITGTPTTGGVYAVTITAIDNAGYSGNATFNWTITNTVSVTNPGAQSDVSGAAITAVPISATDSSSTATLTYSDGGTLPPGLSIDPTSGSITGTPTTGGTYPVTITASDDAGCSGTTTFSWTIGNIVSVTSPGDQSDGSGTAITAVAITATDSSAGATLTYSDGGTLPPGLSIDPTTGSITGTPTTGGVYAVTITATDGSGASGNAAFNWTITNTVSVTSPGDQSDGSGTAITAVAITATDSSSTATLTYSDGGTLPPGLSIDPSSGSITGTPTTAGVYAVTITATDGSGASGSATFNWTVTNAVSVTSPGDQSDGSGTAITAVAITATDSSAGATLAYSDGGTLPPGLSIDPSSGSITGTPTTGGVYAVTITATDGSGASGSATFNWTITNTVSVTSPGDQSDGSGTAITALPITATDSSAGATLTYSDGGTLPPGLSIDPSSGSITGTPTTGGTYPVTITATDSVGYTGNATFTWTITNTVTVAPIGQQSSATGVDITPLVPTATDSQTTPAPVFTWTATDLPPGLTIGRSSGHISGKPTTDGIYSVTVSATDNANPTNTGSTSFEWSVFTIAPVITKVKPATGPGSGGTKVVITGTNLAHASSVSFGSVNAPGFKVNKKGTKITVHAPAQAAGTVDIIVTTPAGGASSPTAADQFTYTGPSILAVSPATGSTAGGTTVTIHGKGMAGATSVAFGPDNAVNPTVNKTGTVITATAPAEAAGTVDIVVTTAGGPSAIVPADQFTYVAPTVTEVSPAGGPPAGLNKVTITGTELGGATSVTFGGAPASIVSVNAKGTKVVVTAPAGSGTVDVIVTTPGGSSGPVAGDQYTYS